MPTLPDELGKAGYHTAIVGKWHLGLESPNTPNERGFAFFHGFLGDMMDSYSKHLRHGNNYMRRNLEVITPKGHATDLFSDWAADYLRERAKTKDQPFFLYLAYNGGSLPHAQNNDPWRGGKGEHYDGGLRVPVMVRWPARIKPGSRSDYAGLVFDFFPTFVELAGGKPAAEIDAVSLVPLLQGGETTHPRELYFVRREGGIEHGGNSYEAIIRGDWKLLRNDPYSPLELYNIKADPQESQNLAASHPKMFEELANALRHHIQRGGATPWQKAQP